MMTRRFFSHLIGGAFAGLSQPQSTTARPPNFVVFLADDLGWGDLGCYGNNVIRTPNVDRLAAEGVRLTNFYAAPTCTPARAALLTGRYPIRSGMVRVLIPKEHFGLPASELTLAEALQSYGYRTTCIGKWHLGSGPRYRPRQHGFDEFLGILYSHDMTLPVVNWPRVKLIRDDKPAEVPLNARELTPRLTAEAIRFIGENREHPFFLYLSYHLPHVPWMPSADFQGKSEYGPYGDSVEEMDSSVGEVLRALERYRVSDNTVVLFTSDNGPDLNTVEHGGSTAGLRGGKGTTWEGGVRVPCIARWPGLIPKGTVLDGITSILDVFPTVLGMAGKAVPKDRAIDGVDLTEYLTDKGPVPRDHLFFYRGKRLFAVRCESWKLHFLKKERRRKGGWTDAVPCDPPELYNLESDPGERRNVAEINSDVVERLTRLSNEFESLISLGRLPKPRWRSVLP
jgi:arylsulfatase A-like enzyme